MLDAGGGEAAVGLLGRDLPDLDAGALADDEDDVLPLVVSDVADEGFSGDAAQIYTGAAADAALERGVAGGQARERGAAGLLAADVRGAALERAGPLERRGGQGAGADVSSVLERARGAAEGAAGLDQPGDGQLPARTGGGALEKGGAQARAGDPGVRAASANALPGRAQGAARAGGDGAGRLGGGAGGRAAGANAGGAAALGGGAAGGQEPKRLAAAVRGAGAGAAARSAGSGGAVGALAAGAAGAGVDEEEGSDAYVQARYTRWLEERHVNSAVDAVAAAGEGTAA